MQFYKINGRIKSSEIKIEKEHYKARDHAQNIYEKTDLFNERNFNNACCFVSDLSENELTIGAIMEQSSSPYQIVSKYLRTLGICFASIEINEITLNQFCNVLRCADRGNYIEQDKLMNSLGLDLLFDRRQGICFGEKILEGGQKEKIYKLASGLYADNTLIPELDRIYAKKLKKPPLGHPVHYFVEAEDRHLRNNLYKTLLNALFDNNRVHSRRYSYVDIDICDELSESSYERLYVSNFGGTLVVRVVCDDDRQKENTDTVELICRTMQKYANRVLTVFCLSPKMKDIKKTLCENLKNISFVELKEDIMSGEKIEKYFKSCAASCRIRADKKLIAAAEQNRGYTALELNEIFDEWYGEKLRSKVYPRYKELEVKPQAPVQDTGESAYERLNKMVGVAEAKSVITQLLNYQKAQHLFADKGLKADKMSMHMVFSGSPGTAKTTVARLFAEIAKENHLLSKGELIEVGRGDLIGKYVGWTAKIIKDYFQKAQGCVLFIDEAYSLVDDRKGSFGDEAINTIVQEMENHRDDIIVIFAGYSDEMQGFLDKNPGLRSRIAYHVSFPDYDTEALCKIAEQMAEQKGLSITEAAHHKLADLFEQARKQSDFGNGRYVRNVIEKARLVQASRLLTMDPSRVSAKDIALILEGDIEIPHNLSQPKSRKIGF